MQKVENSNRILKSEYFPIHDKRAVDLMEVVRKAVPGPSYTLEERLNQILVEGEPAEIERVRKLLQAVGSK
jgi:DNA polymerase elongation subunit (family B)